MPTDTSFESQFMPTRLVAIRCLSVVLTLSLLAAMTYSVVAHEAAVGISPRLPYVQSPVAITWPDATAQNPVRIVVKDSDEQTVWEGRLPAEQAVASAWTPEKTGYYDAEVYREDRLLAEHRFAVVWRPLYFPVWPILTPEDAEALPYLTSTMLTKTESDNSYWNARGSTTLQTVYYRARDHFNPERPAEEMARDLADRWAKPFTQGADGVFIDELTGYPNPYGQRLMEVEGEALKLLRKQHPDKLIFPAQGGSLWRERASSFKDSDSMALLETYVDFSLLTFGSHSWRAYINQRVEMARDTDLIFQRGYKTETTPDQFRRHGAILLISMNHVGSAPLEEPAPARLEMHVRYTKQTAPEMPGVGFYGLWQSLPYLRDKQLFDEAERLVEKYYIRPVVDLREVFTADPDPVVGNPVALHAELHNIGGMDARDVSVTLTIRNETTGKVHDCGSMQVDRLGTGFAVIRNDTDALETVTMNQNEYVALPGLEHVVQLSRHTGTLQWTPVQPGYHTLTAEVASSDGYTVMDGRLQTTFLVHAAPQ